MQTSYGFSPVIGLPGTLYDINNAVIDTRKNVSDTGAVKYGMGVVRGAVPGNDVAIPTSAATVNKFEGIVVTGHSVEHAQGATSGVVTIEKNKVLGIIRSGRVWARVVPNQTPAYGDPCYLVISKSSGDNNYVGYISNAASVTGHTTMPIPAIFLDTVKVAAQNTAPVEVYPNIPCLFGINDLTDVAVSSATSGDSLVYGTSGWANNALELGDLADVALSSQANGEVLKYDGTDHVWENGEDATATT